MIARESKSFTCHPHPNNTCLYSKNMVTHSIHLRTKARGHYSELRQTAIEKQTDNIRVFREWRSIWHSFAQVKITRSRSITRALTIDQHYAQIGQQLARCSISICCLYKQHQYITYVDCRNITDASHIHAVTPRPSNGRRHVAKKVSYTKWRPVKCCLSVSEWVCRV